MKHLFFLTILIVICTSAFAQYPHRPNYKSTKTTQETGTLNDVEAVVVSKLFRIDLVGIHYEKAYGAQNTIAIAAALAPIYPYSGSNALMVGIGVIPNAELSFRHYYNLEKRKRLNKPYKNNSGNYIAGKVIWQYLYMPIQPKENEPFTGVGTGIVWGIQNNEGPVTLNFEIGAGLGATFQQTYDANASTFGLFALSKLKFGFLLGR